MRPLQNSPKSPKCLGGNLGDFGEFCKGLGIIPWLANSGRSGKGAQTEYALYVEDNIALNGGKTFLTPALRWDKHSVSGSAWTPSLNFSHAFN
ncbi:MAG: TonB-dependent receptor [Neisseria sp.]|nr:MAG: TonB-dependent receptor [Neisseria sp.]